MNRTSPILGHFFDRVPEPPPLPCLRGVARATRGSGGLSPTLLQRSWVVDYSITDCGLTRAGGEHEPWLPRTPGWAHLYPPGTPYWEDMRRSPRPIVSAYVLFDGGERSGLGAFIPAKPAYARFHDPADRIGPLLSGLAALAAAGGNGSFWRAQAGLGALLALLHGAVRHPGGSGHEWMLPSGVVENPDDAFLRRVRELLSTSLGERASLPRLAARLGMSPSTLSHRYRRLAGEGPMGTLLHLRINAAKGLLLTGERVGRVAERTGFCDAFHFSKTFRRLAGVSPRAFGRAVHPL